MVEILNPLISEPHVMHRIPRLLGTFMTALVLSGCAQSPQQINIITATPQTPTPEVLDCNSISFSQPIPITSKIKEKYGITTVPGYATYPMGSDINGAPLIKTSKEAANETGIPILGSIIADGISQGEVMFNTNSPFFILSLRQPTNQYSKIQQTLEYLQLIRLGDRFYSGPVIVSGDAVAPGQYVSANIAPYLVVALDQSGNPVNQLLAAVCTATRPNSDAK